MKFIHISDVHLGAGKDVLREIGINRYDEIWQTFRKSIETAIRMQPDLVLITGDLFHREPLLKELREVNYILSGLRDSKVVIVAGNHDYISDSSYYRTFKWSDNIDMITNDKITCIRYDDIKTTVYGMSYHTREIRENIFDNIVPDNDEINILIAHGGDEKHIPMDYKKILSNGFDYVALGHIHKPDYNTEKKQNIVYPGSTIAMGFDELGKHGFIVGNVEKDSLDIAFIPVDKREFKEIQFDISKINDEDELIEKLNSIYLDENNLYKIILTGKRNFEININNLIKFIIKENIIKIKNETKLNYDLDYMANESTLKGIFINEIINETNKENYTKQELDKILEIGLSILNN